MQCSKWKLTALEDMTSLWSRYSLVFDCLHTWLQIGRRSAKVGGHQLDAPAQGGGERASPLFDLEPGGDSGTAWKDASSAAGSSLALSSAPWLCRQRTDVRSSTGIGRWWAGIYVLRCRLDHMIVWGGWFSEGWVIDIVITMLEDVIKSYSFL